MSTHQSEAEWKGNLKEGKGSYKLGSGQVSGTFSFSSRFEDGKESNPEELIGAAHAGCFSMALSHGLSEAGFAPVRVHTIAKVHLNKTPGGFAITGIDLETEADVPGIDDRLFQEQAAKAKAGCPVSKALAAVPIHLQARLLQPRNV